MQFQKPLFAAQAFYGSCHSDVIFSIRLRHQYHIRVKPDGEPGSHIVGYRNPVWALRLYELFGFRKAAAECFD